MTSTALRFCLLTVTVLRVSALCAPERIVIARDTTISTDLVVDTAQTCRILPGVTIRVEGYRQFLVRGLLIAEATSERPIRMTAVDRPHGSAERPGWQGLSVVGSDAHARLRHVRIEGAFTNGFWESSGAVDSCVIVGNYRGMYCGRGSRPHIKGCHIYRNIFGLVVNQGVPLLLDNRITENTVGVHIENGSRNIIGRNEIRYNAEDIRVDQTLQKTDTVMPVQQLWDLMRRLY